jgi:hypothetical protein
MPVERPAFPEKRCFAEDTEGRAQKVRCSLKGFFMQIELAQMESVCLVTGIKLQLGRTLSGYARLSGSALAALLAVLLLVAAILSVSHALHQCLHSEGAANGHVCLLCSFAKGQVSAMPVALVCGACVFPCLWYFCLASTLPLPGFDYRFSPSRAPPLS